MPSTKGLLPRWILISEDSELASRFAAVFGETAIVIRSLDGAERVEASVDAPLVVFTDLNEANLSRERLFKQIAGDVFAPGEVVLINHGAPTALIVAALRCGAHTVVDADVSVEELSTLKTELESRGPIYGASSETDPALAAFRTPVLDPFRLRALCVLDADAEALYLNEAFRDFLVTGLGVPFHHAQPGLSLASDVFREATVQFGVLGAGLRSMLEQARGATSDFSVSIELDTGLPQARWEAHYFADTKLIGLTTMAMGEAQQAARELLRLAMTFARTPLVNLDAELANGLLKVQAFLGLEGVYLFTIDEERSKFGMMFYRGRPVGDSAVRRELESYDLSKLSFYQNYLRRQAVFIDDVEAMPEAHENSARIRGALSMKSSYEVPIFVDGKLIAVMGFVRYSNPGVLSPGRREALFGFSELVSLVFRRLQLENALKPLERSSIEAARSAVAPAFGVRFDIPIAIHLPKRYQARHIFEGRFIHGNDSLASFYRVPSANEALGRRWVELIGGYKDRAFRLFLHFVRSNYRVEAFLGDEEVYNDGTKQRVLYRAHGIVRDGALREIWGTFTPLDLASAGEVEALAVARESLGGPSIDEPGILEPISAYRNSSLTEKRIGELMNQIMRLFELEKPYRDFDFSLSKLSKLVNASPYQLSQVLSTGLKTNFYDLVNRCRVEDFKELLRRAGSDRLSILDLAVQVGFNSKSTFNNAFKKVTGMTPTQYRAVVSSDVRTTLS